MLCIWNSYIMGYIRTNATIREIDLLKDLFETRWQIMYLFQGPFVPLLRHTWYLRLVLVVISHLDSALSVKDTHICKCEDFPVEDRPFVAIWNAPTGGCSVNYSININLRDFDILENPMQSWDGKFVTVFYNAQLGLYPYYTNPEGTRSYNGGMPQVCKVNVISQSNV